LTDLTITGKMEASEEDDEISNDTNKIHNSNLNQTRESLRNCVDNEMITDITDNIIKKINKNKLLCDFGTMNYQCHYCKAVYWKEEKFKSICCHKGTIYLPPLSEYNEELKILFLNDSTFRLLIRYYNSLFSYSTFIANVINDRDKTLYNLKIQGQIRHKAPNYLLVENNETPSCGQFYIYDDNDVIEKKIENEREFNEGTCGIIS